MVLLCVIFSLTTDVFLTWRNALNVIDQITVLGILAIGMTAVIVIGGIDLSVGSVLAFSMMMMGWLYQSSRSSARTRDRCGPSGRHGLRRR